jgi:multidrug efflux pump
MNLSAISIRNPVFAWMIMFSLILFGLIGYSKLGINENPDVDFPTLSISYNYEGATPEVVEKDILEPVESVLVSMQGVKNMNSTASRGSGRISLEFDLDKDIDFALQEVQTLLGRAQRLIPDSVETPTVTKSNAADDPILFLALTSKSLSPREMNLLFKNQIIDRLSTVEGVSEIRAFGSRDPVMRIDIDPKKLKELKFTISDVIETIRREHLELPAGKIEYDDRDESLRILGEGVKPSDFQNMMITRRGGRANYVPVKLSEVADITAGLENETRISRVNGIPSLSMPIFKQRNANAVSTADAIKLRVEEINKELPPETNLSVNFDRTTFVRLAIDELVMNLILSAILTSIVCWLFLNSFSATINILLAIPTSIIGTFAFMSYFGLTLNTFTFLALSMAIGIVVDDAIVMLENIVRYAKMGYNKVDASFKGSKEITFAVIATTTVLVAIFAPIMMLPGIEGRFFREFSFTLCVAVSLSSVEALTLAPMRCSQFLDINGKGTIVHRWVDAFVDSCNNFYEKVLKKSLQFKGTVTAIAFGLLILSIYSVRFIGKEFAPEADRGFLFVVFNAPDGKNLAYTNSKIKEYEAIISKHPDVARYIVTVGGGGGGSGSGSNRGSGVIILKDLGERKQTQFQFAEELREQLKEIKGIRIIIRDRTGSNLGGRRGSPIEFILTGPDSQRQRELYKELEKEMEASGMMTGTRSDDVAELPEVHISPNRAAALSMGVDVKSISETVNTAFAGLAAAKYTDGGRRYDLFVQLKEKDKTLDNLSELLVVNNRGEYVSINKLVDIKEAKGPQSLYRENRLQALRVDSNLKDGVVQSKAVDFVNEIASKILDKDYQIIFSKNLKDSMRDMILIMILGIVIAYMVLASQFNSFIDPFIVFMSLPFGLLGAFGALLVTGQTLNIYSMIGLLLTIGIVKKTSILIVEFTNQLRDEGKSVEESLLYACRTRFRPIIMTTFTTLASALPAAIMTGAGSETRIPMAVVVLGGVFLATIFTLVVVPCFYSLVSRNRRPILIESITSS